MPDPERLAAEAAWDDWDIPSGNTYRLSFITGYARGYIAGATAERSRGEATPEHLSGSTRRVIENMAERILAGESAKSVAADYPDEYGYGPLLDGVEKLRSKGEALAAAVREMIQELHDNFDLDVPADAPIAAALARFEQGEG